MDQAKLQFSKSSPGFILATAMVIMSVMLLTAVALFDFLHNENQLVTGQKLATKTYYLAEGGLQYGLWRLKTDANLQDNFKTNPAWQVSFTQTNLLADNSSYTVTLKNHDLAQADIMATATLKFGEFSNQRVVASQIFQAVAPYHATPTTMFIDNGLNFNGVLLNSNDGEIYTNHNIFVAGFSTLNVASGIKSTARINVNLFSTINGQKNSTNYPPAPAARSLPQLDFDSDSEFSLLRQATTVYNQQEFDDLISANDHLTFDNIIYVHGNINIPRGKTVTINGALVADGNISLGTDAWPEELAGPALSLYHTVSKPSGLFAKQNITFGDYLTLVAFNGVAYALNTLTFSNNNNTWTINGAVYGQQGSFSSLWQALTVNYQAEIVASVFGAQVAPIITTGHWEEEY
ncbi:MAG: hypothetical protein NTV81_02645 [Candidatus Komeilibacteria bacterium]|nr:hypothetical protein [Candidatus Komeilibacteria bacterium]